MAGLPIRYIEKMFSVSSREMYFLTLADLMAIGWYASWYEELTIATCGPDPTKSRTYPSIEAYGLAIKEYGNTTYRCMGKAVTSDQGKVIDRILGDKSWRSK